jgi:hypothetical protein
VEDARDGVRGQLGPVPPTRQLHVLEHRDVERWGFPGSPPSTFRISGGRMRR